MSLTAGQLDLLAEDLAIIERYTREPDRKPGDRTVEAFQRAGRQLTGLVAVARAHLSDCAILAPGGGYWLTCPSIVLGSACDAEWLSHDLLTTERIHRHLADRHGYTEAEAYEMVQHLRAVGRIP